MTYLGSFQLTLFHNSVMHNKSALSQKQPCTSQAKVCDYTSPSWRALKKWERGNTTVDLFKLFFNGKSSFPY